MKLSFERKLQLKGSIALDGGQEGDGDHLHVVEDKLVEVHAIASTITTATTISLKSLKLSSGFYGKTDTEWNHLCSDLDDKNVAVVDVGEVVSNLQRKTIKSVTIKDLEIGKQRNQSKILTFSSETMRGICCSLISAWEQKSVDGYQKI